MALICQYVTSVPVYLCLPLENLSDWYLFYAHHFKDGYYNLPRVMATMNSAKIMASSTRGRRLCTNRFGVIHRLLENCVQST